VVLMTPDEARVEAKRIKRAISGWGVRLKIPFAKYNAVCRVERDRLYDLYGRTNHSNLLAVEIALAEQAKETAELRTIPLTGLTEADCAAVAPAPKVRKLAKALASPGPDGAESLAKPKPVKSVGLPKAPPTVDDVVLKREEARLAGLAAEQAAKDALVARAGNDPSRKKAVEFAENWGVRVRSNQGPRWELVTEAPPCAFAVELLAMCVEKPADFIAARSKLLGKDGGEEDDALVQRERKREADLLRLLDEVDAEVAARGSEAYA
jgi:hypothetical protein